jgi:hypothetical protein
MHRDHKEQAADWLEALPSSTLADLMQRRCRFIGGVAKVVDRGALVSLLTDAQLAQLEDYQPRKNVW